MSDYEFWDELGKIFNAVLAYQEKTIEFNKRFINPWIRLGNVFDRQDHNRDAIRAYQKAIEIDPENAQNWVELGNVYFRSEAYEEAVQAFTKAIELNPQLGWPLSNLALTLVTQGKYSEAVPLFLKSIDLLSEDKDMAMAWNRLGNVYRKLNEYELAVEAFQKADELDAENAGFHDDLDEMPTGISLPAEQGIPGVAPVPGPTPDLIQMVMEESQVEVVGTPPQAAGNAAQEPKTQPTQVREDKNPAVEAQPASVVAEQVPPSSTPVAPENQKVAEAAEADKDQALDQNPNPSGLEAAGVITTAGNPDQSLQAAKTDSAANAAPVSQDAPVSQANQSAGDGGQTVTVVVQNVVETYTDYSAVVNATTETSEPVAANPAASTDQPAPAEPQPDSNPEPQAEPTQPASTGSLPGAVQGENADTPVAVEKDADPVSVAKVPEAKAAEPVVEAQVEKETEVVIVREVTAVEETIEKPVHDAGLSTGQVAYEEFLKDSVEAINLLAVQPGKEMAEKPGPTNPQEPATRLNSAGELQIEMDTKNAHVWNELGNVYFNSCAYDDAIVAYSKAIELDRWFAWPYSNLALAYVQKGRFAEAILLYQRSIELFSDDKDKAISWNRLGNVYRRMNDYDNAISAYQRADELDPGNSTLSLQSRFSLLGAYAADQKPNYVL